MRKGFVIFVFLGFWAFLLNSNVFADENPAVNPTENGSVTSKLDKIIDTQTEILKQLDEVKAELQIVKVRASQG